MTRTAVVVCVVLFNASRKSRTNSDMKRITAQTSDGVVYYVHGGGGQPGFLGTLIAGYEM